MSAFHLGFMRKWCHLTLSFFLLLDSPGWIQRVGLPCPTHTNFSFIECPLPSFNCLTMPPHPLCHTSEIICTPDSVNSETDFVHF